MGWKPDISIVNCQHGGVTSWVVRVERGGLILGQQDADEYCDQIKLAAASAARMNTER